MEFVRSLLCTVYFIGHCIKGMAVSGKISSRSLKLLVIAVYNKGYIII